MFYQILLNIVKIYTLHGIWITDLFKLSNKSFKVSKNRAVCCIFFALVLPVSEAKNMAVETSLLKT